MGLKQLAKKVIQAGMDTGLGQAAINAGSDMLADQWKEYFYCDALPVDVLVAKGQKRIGKKSQNTKGSENIITNGSVIATSTDNQVDEKLIKAETQPVILLNCIADPTNEKDGTWKKANNFEWTVMAEDMNTDKGGTDFQKKYKYVLISTHSLQEGTTQFKNKSTEKLVTFNGSANESNFVIKKGINVYNNVNPAGAADNVNVPPSDTNT